MIKVAAMHTEGSGGSRPVSLMGGQGLSDQRALELSGRFFYVDL
jgi:hypothetical protein